MVGGLQLLIAVFLIQGQFQKFVEFAGNVRCIMSGLQLINKL